LLTVYGRTPEGCHPGDVLQVCTCRCGSIGTDAVAKMARGPSLLSHDCARRDSADAAPNVSPMRIQRRPSSRDKRTIRCFTHVEFPMLEK
jgi:hypothetical protein